MKRSTKPYFEAVINKDELDLLLNYWSKVSHPRGIRNNLFFHILADTGIRLGELIVLEREDINFNTSEINIRGRHKHQNRTLKLSSDTLVLLKHFLSVRLDDCQSLIPRFKANDGYIVKAWPLTSRSIQRVISSTAINIGIPKLINPKTFRAMKYFELIKKKTKLNNIITELGLSPTSTEYLRYGRLK